MLPKEWSDKKGHSLQLHNGQRKKLRDFLASQGVKEIAG